MYLEVIGNLGNDAERREDNGRAYLLFSVADTDSYTKADGTKVENTTWINCIYNGDGERLLPYLKKGTKVYVRGRQSLRVFSSAKERCMKAGVDLNVREIELVGGSSDIVPRELVDANGVIHQVHKAYYIAQQGIDALPADNRTLLPKRGVGAFAVDQYGFVTTLASPASEEQLAADAVGSGTEHDS